MRHILISGFMALVLSLSSAAWAADTYRLQVDGLACPFCAYGVEKKLNETQGVESIDIRINEGVVLVAVSEDSDFDRALAKRVMKEAGFTLNGFEKVTRTE